MAVVFHLGERKDHRYWSQTCVHILVLPSAMYSTLARSLQQVWTTVNGNDSYITIIRIKYSLVRKVLVLHIIGALQMVAISSGRNSDTTSGGSGNVNIIIICSNTY